MSAAAVMTHKGTKNDLRGTSGVLAGDGRGYRRQMELAESRLAAALIVLFLLLLAEATEGNHLPRLHRYSRGLQRD